MAELYRSHGGGLAFRDSLDCSLTDGEVEAERVCDGTGLHLGDLPEVEGMGGGFGPPPGSRPALALRLEGGKLRELNYLACLNPDAEKKLRRGRGWKPGTMAAKECSRSLAEEALRAEHVAP